MLNTPLQTFVLKLAGWVDEEQQVVLFQNSNEFSCGCPVVVA